MPDTTSYAIIGTGRLGLALAQLFARAAINVQVANSRGPDAARAAIGSLGGHVQPVTATEAAESEVLFLAVPWASIPELGSIRADWSSTTLIDTTNAHWTPGWQEILAGQMSTHYVVAHFPGAQVVKAFNQLPAPVLVRSLQPEEGRRVVFVSGDSDDATRRVGDLTSELGLAPVMLGPIAEGGRLIQAPGLLMMRDLTQHADISAYQRTTPHE